MTNKIEEIRIIAEFMGEFDKIIPAFKNNYSWSDSPHYYTSEYTREKVERNICEYLERKKDWNWIMKVVEKIEELSYWVEILGGRENNICQIGITNNIESFILAENTRKIESVYSACVEFIKWYNSQPINKD